MEILLLIVVGVLVIIFAYVPLERHLIRKQIQKEFEQLDYDFSWTEYTCQGLLTSIWHTRYLRRLEGIEGVAKFLYSGHRARAHQELMFMFDLWVEDGRGFQTLRGINLV